ncbi:hypothetical protein CRG98_005362 [Punica granatum]|nr:hypothetical protein CRG98_005362 [Punica granatum]
MKASCVYGAFLFLLLAITDAVESTRAYNIEEDLSRPTADSIEGTRWAVLVAGSNGYNNYRHQADVCHAYQILKQGGLKDENIIVFMYDDIAYNEDNPTPGFVVNKPYGPNVYHGVPKDYTGNDTNVNNLYAVLLGNKSALTGGSGKVLSSGPNDHVFFYYTDHGGPGILAMPVGDLVYAKDLIEVLKKKHEMKGYKRMAIYIEACESGSMVSGLLPGNVNVYSTTASKPDENSWGCYCPGDDDDDRSQSAGKTNNSTATPGSPDFYGTCLGDLYSVAWLEDSDVHDPRKETMRQQYKRVKKRTNASHVMQYGDMSLNNVFRSLFMGPNYPDNNLSASTRPKPFSSSSGGMVISQRDAKLAYLRNKVQIAPDGSLEQLEAQMRLRDELLHREQVDRKIGKIAKLLLGEKDGLVAVPNTVLPEGQPLVNDWECFKTMLRTYEEHCGALTHYGRKYTRVMANMCNAGVNKEQLIWASTEACS